MNWALLLQILGPMIGEIAKAISDAEAAGKSPDLIHQTITDHVAALPAKIRES